MCGICGMFDMKNQMRINKEIVDKMAHKLLHRGPDQDGSYVVGNLAFGFTRLSIIDLNGGMQPLFNEDKKVVLVCNGEIFNYRELRRELIEKGHQFRTNCDVEVILHMYEEKGIEFVNDLNGQFAFALYDFKINKLFCARDYAGIAPLFYTIVDGMFLFASEIKSILEYPSIKRVVDVTGLDQVFTFPGIISPRTMFKDISSLQGGHYLCVDYDSIRNHEYWDLDYREVSIHDIGKSEAYYVEKLDELLTQSVKLRLNADVPIGFYISGGLDSSIIASKIKEIGNVDSYKSFSIDFTEKNVSEAKYQRIMADYVGSDHSEILFDFEKISSRLNDVVYFSECPLKETYNTASMALSEFVNRNSLKVVLTGEGADELFGGYVGYRFDKFRGVQNAVNDSLTPEQKVNLEIWGDKDFTYEKSYYSFQNVKKGLYSRQLNEIYEQFNCLNHFVIDKNKVDKVDIFHRRSYIDFKLRMSDHLLSDHGDRMAYANSVEARYPFLDKNLIEFAKQIPIELKLKNYNEKYILKKMASRYVPKEIINRPKFAFTAPGSPLLLQQNIEYINDLLSYERIKRQGYFNADMVEQLKKKYKDNNFKLNVPYDNDLLITVITFGIFLDKFHMPALI